MKIQKGKDEARQSLKNGVDRVAAAVSPTLGPNGRNAILDRGRFAPLITNDGVTIAKEVEAEDEAEQLGVRLMQVVAEKQNVDVGDGTTTAIVLAQALLDVGLEKIGRDSLVDEGIQMSLKREIDENAKEVVEELKNLAKPIKTDKEIENIASISAENVELGKVIAKVIKEVGPDGVVTVEDSEKGTTEYTIEEGYSWEKGYESPYMCTNFQKMTTEFKNTKVLLCKSEISTIEGLKVLLQSLKSQGTDRLVIVAQAFGGNTIPTAVHNRQTGAFNLVLVESPGYGDKGLEELEDLAAFTGAIPYEKLEDVSPEGLGEVQKVFVEKDKATLIGGNGDPQKRVEQIRANPVEPEWLDERIAKLTGGVGVIKVGAESKTEAEYLKLKIEDAVNATRAAIEEGVVQGGGKALASIKTKGILKDVLQAPYEQIKKNAGGEMEIGKNVLDPVKVTRTALLSATSVVGTLITTDTLIAIKKDDELLQLLRKNKEG